MVVAIPMIFDILSNSSNICRIVRGFVPSFGYYNLRRVGLKADDVI